VAGADEVAEADDVLAVDAGTTVVGGVVGHVDGDAPGGLGVVHDV
jgi:hypothetical protein